MYVWPTTVEPPMPLANLPLPESLHGGVIHSVAFPIHACRLFLFLSFAYRLFLFSVLLFLDRRHPTGGLAQAFAARSGSSFRRAVWLMLSPAVLLKLSPRPMLSAFVFRRWPQALAVVPQVHSSAFPVLLGL
jgi:hypothetical protein